MAEIFFPEKMEHTEGMNADEILKIHDDYIRYIVERIDFAFNGYTNKKKFFQAVEDVVEDGPLAKELENEKSAREQAIDQLNEKLQDAGGLFTTVDPETGIVYMHDKKEEPGLLPPYTESRNVIMISTAGIAVSNDGGVTYPMGFSLDDGVAILNKIYAIGIDAKYIKANTLSADKIESTEGTYSETASWNSQNTRFILAYMTGRIDKETAIQSGADINGDGNVDFLDLAILVDALLNRAVWNENGGMYKAQIKCENAFNAISITDGDKTAFSAGIHGAYMANAYVGSQVKIYESRYASQGATQDGVTLDSTKLYLRNPFGQDESIPEELKYMGYQGNVTLDHGGIKFNSSPNYTYGVNGYQFGKCNITYSNVVYDNVPGKAGYVALLTIEINGSYANGPMQMEICDRSYFVTAYLTLSNTSIVQDIVIESFRYRGIGSPTLIATIEDDYYYTYTSDGTQVTNPLRKVIVYAKKVGDWEAPCIVSFKTSDYQGERIYNIHTGGHWFSEYAPTGGITATAL